LYGVVKRSIVKEVSDEEDDESSKNKNPCKSALSKDLGNDEDECDLASATSSDCLSGSEEFDTGAARLYPDRQQPARDGYKESFGGAVQPAEAVEAVQAVQAVQAV